MNHIIDSSQDINPTSMRKIFVFVTLTLLAGSILFLFKQRVGPKNQEVLSLSVRDYLLSSFLAELPDINKKLPYAVDDKTILKHIEYKEGKIIQSYELNKYQKNSESERNISQSLIPALKKQACADPVRQNMLTAGIDFSSIYRDAAGQLIFEITFNQASCSEVDATSQIQKR